MRRRCALETVKKLPQVQPDFYQTSAYFDRRCGSWLRPPGGRWDRVGGGDGVGAGLDPDGAVAAGRCARTCGATSASGPRSSALLVTPVRSGVYHPDSFRSAGQQKIRHTLRIKATGINPESNVRQAISGFGYLIGHATGPMCCQASLGRCYSAMTVVARCVGHKFVHKYGHDLPVSKHLLCSHSWCTGEIWRAGW